jgi:hypothetical protein
MALPFLFDATRRPRSARPRPRCSACAAAPPSSCAARRGLRRLDDAGLECLFEAPATYKYTRAWRLSPELITPDAVAVAVAAAGPSRVLLAANRRRQHFAGAATVA